MNGKIVKQKNVTDVGGHEKTYVNELGITSNGIKILVSMLGLLWGIVELT